LFRNPLGTSIDKFCRAVWHGLFLLLPDFGGEAAAVELDGDGVAEGDLAGVAEEVAGGVGGDGVAAFEDFQRAALFELQSQPGKLIAPGAQESLGAEAEVGSTFLEAQAERGNFYAKIEGCDAQV